VKLENSKEPKKKLREEHKQFIFERLGCGFSQSDVADSLKDRFGIEITPQSINYYAQEYPEKVEEARQRLLEDAKDIGFTDKLQRLAYLDRIARKQHNKRQYRECCATLKQIAEEVGSIIHKHEHSGPGGGPIETQQVNDLSTFTDDELKQLRAIHETANARRDQQGAGGT
jgi:hypothetical protein